MIPWIAAARPRTLVAGAVPVAVGSAVAWREGAYRPSVFWAALFGALFIQAGANYVNDASDFLRGADTADRLGPRRMAQAGLLTPRALFIGASVFFLMAVVCGAHLIQVAGWPILVIGSVSILFAIAYTAGPFPLAYLGLGDFFVLIFFGIVAVLGTKYAHSGDLSSASWVLAVAVGLQATALIAVNNTRDIPTDDRAGKRTLSVKLGLRWSRVYYSVITLAPFLSIPFLVRELGWAMLFPLLSFPFAISNVKAMGTAGTPAEFNNLLGATARLQALFGAGSVVGLIFG
ncbi:MAG: 1,4-dihydroxy-2-naphthoate polyprenyltransferase [Bdellovibrionales bacterium]|nr:1,4-dihydroxy-2-naphthoate polyprenyltransferase [Bdellovibrionales bacterium]